MAGEKRPTPEDRDEAIRIALSGIAHEVDPGDLAFQLEPLHPRNNTFRAEVLLGLAADAIDESGATRDSPIAFENIRERYLPEYTARSKAEHHKSQVRHPGGGDDAGRRRSGATRGDRLVAER